MSAATTARTPLRQDTLAQVGERVPVPTYDRGALRHGIAHLGVGGFHRAHQAMYLDELMNRGEALDWAITGVGLMPGDARMAEAMAAQDCLYTVVVKHPDGSREPRVVGSMVDYLFAPERGAEVLDLLADPATRIVSLTVTEGGYHVHQVTGELDADDDGLRHDLALADGELPVTAFGYVVEALARRRAAGTAPFTVMSCDNIQGNGHVASRMLTAFARLRDPALADWIAAEVRFPNSMVDRITPVTTPEDREDLAAHSGIEDAWPVVCEPFTQWVLEDDFVGGGRPALEDVDVQVVPDVTPYELMKLRLLNAGHQALAYLGVLAGYTYAHEAAADPLLERYLLGYMEQEASPTLAPLPGLDLDAYRHRLIERFANPEIRDTLARLCAESSDRIPKWLLPVVRERLAAGGEVRHAALTVAAWSRYAEAVDEQGQPIEVVDRRRDAVLARARAQAEDPLAFLRDPDLFGDLVDEPGFTGPYLEARALLHEVGAEETLRRWVG